MRESSYSNAILDEVYFIIRPWLQLCERGKKGYKLKDAAIVAGLPELRSY